MCIVLKKYFVYIHEHSCSWGTRFPSTRQGIPRIFVTKIDYIIHKGSPLVSITPQKNAAHNAPSYSPQRQFNIILQIKWSHYFKFFSPKLSYTFSFPLTCERQALPLSPLQHVL